MTKLKKVLYGDRWWLCAEIDGKLYKLMPREKAGERARSNG
jgi:hypothetical protein